LALPTIFLVLVFAFFLGEASRSDEVASLMAVEGVSSDINKDEYVRIYGETRKQLGLDKPSFYFQVLPSYMPGTLDQIIPESHSRKLKKLVRQTKSWTSVGDFQQQLDRTLLVANRNGAINREVINALNQINQTSSITQIRTLIRPLTQKVDGEISEQALVAELERLDRQTEALVPMKSIWIMPRWIWHGIDNRFHYWFTHLTHLDASRSLTDGTPVVRKVLKSLRWTLAMTLSALILAILLAWVLGLILVRLDGTRWDHMITGFLYALYAMPLFWLATMTVIFFTTSEYGRYMHLFPSIGVAYWLVDEPFHVQVAASASQLILPVLLLASHPLAYLTRQLRTSIEDVFSMPFVRSLRARGLPESRILRKHVLPNASLPFVTIITGALPAALVGSVIIEVIFNIPGTGKLMYDAVRLADWPVLLFILALVSMVTILSFLLADILTILIFPKVSKSILER
jgi:peptide/nickel transport system permease protein